MAREPGHQVVSGREAIEKHLRWLTDEYAAGRIEGLSLTVISPDRMDSSVRWRDGDAKP
jgi:hypothetical protein